MMLYWPIVFAIVAAVAALIGFIDTDAPGAAVARGLTFLFLGLAAILAVACLWQRRRTGFRDQNTRGRHRLFRDMM